MKIYDFLLNLVHILQQKSQIFSIQFHIFLEKKLYVRLESAALEPKKKKTYQHTLLKPFEKCVEIGKQNWTLWC